MSTFKNNMTHSKTIEWTHLEKHLFLERNNWYMIALWADAIPSIEPEQPRVPSQLSVTTARWLV